MGKNSSSEAHVDFYFTALPCMNADEKICHTSFPSSLTYYSAHILEEARRRWRRRRLLLLLFVVFPAHANAQQQQGGCSTDGDSNEDCLFPFFQRGRLFHGWYAQYAPRIQSQTDVNACGRMASSSSSYLGLQTARNTICLTGVRTYLRLCADCTTFENNTDAQCAITRSQNYTALQLATCSKTCLGESCNERAVMPLRSHSIAEEAKKQCLTPHYVGDAGVVNASATCRFPFGYKGRRYFSCTTAGHTESWCATSFRNGETRTAHQWGPCQPGCPGYVAVADDTCRAEKGGAVCQFPFLYKNVTYAACTLAGHHKPWCATAVDQRGGVGDLWGECKPNCPGIDKHDPWQYWVAWNAPLSSGYEKSLDRCLAKDGWPCVLPFVYRDEVYRSCALVDHSQPWCSILNYANGSVARWQACRESDQCSGTYIHVVDRRVATKMSGSGKSTIL